MCINILNAPTVMSVGNTVTLAAQCCGATNVPALDGFWLLLAALLVVAGLLAAPGRRGRVLLGLWVVGAVTSLAPPAGGQPGSQCSTAFSWQARSTSQTLTAAGAVFNFIPAHAEPYTITLSNGQTTATALILVALPAPGPNSTEIDYKEPNATPSPYYSEWDNPWIRATVQTSLSQVTIRGYLDGNLDAENDEESRAWGKLSLPLSGLSH
jgi:hypothetical protein